MAEQLYVRTIIEIIGSPEDYVKETLGRYLDKLKKEFTITNTDLNDPIAQDEGLYSAFAELEITFKDFDQLFSFCLDAMPSSIEILEPSHVELDAAAFSDFLNDIQTKLHTADMIVKKTRATQKKVDTNAQQIISNFIAYVLRTGPQTKEELENATGIRGESLTFFLDAEMKDKKVVMHNNKYESQS